MLIARNQKGNLVSALETSLNRKILIAVRAAKSCPV